MSDHLGFLLRYFGPACGDGDCEHQYCDGVRRYLADKARADIGHTGSGRVRLRRTATPSGGGGVVLEIGLSERPHRDASPGVEYPQATAHVALGVLDLATLHLLLGRRLEELVPDPGRRAKLAQDAEYLYRPSTTSAKDHAEKP